MMNSLANLIPGGMNPMMMMRMVTQMAQDDPDTLAKILAQSGQVPPDPATLKQMSEGSIGQQVAGANPQKSVAEIFRERSMAAKAKQPNPVVSPESAGTVMPPGVVVPRVPETAMAQPDMEAVKAEMNKTAAAAPAAGGSPDAAVLAQVLSAIKPPEAPPQPQLLQPLSPGQGGVGGNVNTAALDQLIKLMQMGGAPTAGRLALGGLVLPRGQ